MPMLTRAEILHLIQALRELFAYQKNLAVVHPAARWIRAPRVPEQLSEGIAADLLNSGFFGGRKFDIRPSTSGGDLELATESGPPAPLEVKGTSETAWVQIGKKDVAA